MTFNDVAFTADTSNWKNYWEWMDNRNDARWIDQENGKLDYDAKNMMHSFRLVLSTKTLLKTGEPTVRFEGKDKDFLMSIRHGEFKYDDIFGQLQKEMAALEEIKDKTKLPQAVNQKKILKLYNECLNDFR